MSESALITALWVGWPIFFTLNIQAGGKVHAPVITGEGGSKKRVQSGPEGRLIAPISFAPRTTANEKGGSGFLSSEIYGVPSYGLTPTGYCPEKSWKIVEISLGWLVVHFQASLSTEKKLEIASSFPSGVR